MTIQLALRPEIEVRLRAQAAALGKDIETFVLDTLEERLARHLVESQPAERAGLDEWIRRFDSWIASHAPLGTPVDDSRESIYAGRGA